MTDRYVTLTEDSRLKQLYTRYSRRYFNGELPDHILIGWSSTGYEGKGKLFLGLTRICLNVKKFSSRKKLLWQEDKTFIIVLHPLCQKDDSIKKLTLLHELIHVYLPWKFGHGPRFQAEMLRLAKAGAFKGIW